MKFISLFLCVTLLLTLSACSKSQDVHNFSESSENSSTSQNLKGFFDYNLPEPPYSLYNSGFPNQFIDWCNTAIYDNSVYEQYSRNEDFINYLRNSKKILLPRIDSDGFLFDNLIVSTGKVGYNISYNKVKSERELTLNIVATDTKPWLSHKKIIKETYHCIGELKKQKLFNETYYVAENDEELKYYCVKKGFAVCLAYREYDFNDEYYRYCEIKDDIINITFEIVKLNQNNSNK